MSQEKLRYGYQDSVRDDLKLLYGEHKDRSLTPCARIIDPDLQVGIIGNNNLQARRFLLGGKDRQPIKLHDTSNGQLFELKYPGKSAFLYFEQEVDRSIVSGLVEQNLERPIKRDDHLHLATVAEIEKAGWQVFWAPLPERSNWEHVRLVAAITAEQGIAPTLNEAIALNRVFAKAA